jgi:hypothetical protein
MKDPCTLRGPERVRKPTATVERGLCLLSEHVVRRDEKPSSRSTVSVAVDQSTEREQGDHKLNENKPATTDETLAPSTQPVRNKS